jgi:cysteine synthase A
MGGAIDKARDIASDIEHAFYPGQFSNPANPGVHRQTTAPEIWEDTGGDIDIFVAGIGTGGTITGVGEFLKDKDPSIEVIGVEPERSAVISGRPAGAHNIQGIGAGFIPDILNTCIIDEIFLADDGGAAAMSREIARREGIFCGISSGAALQGAMKAASRPENEGKVIVTVFPDSGERYLSTGLFG